MTVFHRMYFIGCHPATLPFNLGIENLTQCEGPPSLHPAILADSFEKVKEKLSRLQYGIKPSCLFLLFKDCWQEWQGGRMEALHTVYPIFYSKVEWQDGRVADQEIQFHKIVVLGHRRVGC